MRKTLRDGAVYYGDDAPDAPPTKITVTRAGSSYLIRCDKWPFGKGPVAESWCRLAANVRRTIRSLGYMHLRRAV